MTCVCCVAGAGEVVELSAVVAGAVDAVAVDVSVMAVVGAGIALAGSVASEPMSSSTTGAFAYGSDVDVFFGATVCCECTSLTTGIVRRTGFVAVVGTTDGRACCFTAGSAGSGASACTVGTRKIGAANDGNVSDGNAARGALDTSDV